MVEKYWDTLYSFHSYIVVTLYRDINPRAVFLHEYSLCVRVRKCGYNIRIYIGAQTKPGMEFLLEPESKCT